MYQNYKVSIYTKSGELLKELFLENVFPQQDGDLIRFTAKKGHYPLVVSTNQCIIIAEEVDKVGV